MKKIKPEVGKCYKDRSGNTHGPLEQIRVEWTNQDWLVEPLKDNIRTGWNIDGRFSPFVECPLDLMEEVPDPRSIGQIIRANAAPVDEEFKAKAIATATAASQNPNPPKSIFDSLNIKSIGQPGLSSVVQSDTDYEEREKEPVVFRTGDRVRAFGLEGTVVSDGGEIMVEFGSETGNVRQVFNSIGLAQFWHKEPSLTLVSRAKRKVTKTIERWVNVGPTYEAMFLNRRDADACVLGNRIACVKLTGTYTTEE